MEEVYKVGVTFALKNLVSAEMLKIAAQFRTANKEAQAFQATLKAMGSMSGVGVVTGIGAAARGMGDSFKYAAVQVDGVRAKLNQIKPVVQNTGFWGANASMAKWGLAYGGYEAAKSGIGGAMSMDDVIARGMIAMGLPVGPNYMSSGVAGGIRSSIYGTATAWGVGINDTQDAALQAMRALAPLTPEKRMKLLPSIMNFAGAEVLGKHGTTMEEATEAGIALAHQLRAYSPEQIEPLLGAFAKLSMASPLSLSQMARASSYYLPLLTAGLGMDPTELMALGTVGSQMGLNTKAGTWLARMFQAPFTSDLTSSRQSARRSALEALGLVEDGQVVTKDPLQFLSILASHASGMTPETRMKDFVAAFGQEGARAAAIFTDPAVMKNLGGLAQGLKTAPTPDALKAQYGNSPQVQYNKATEEFDKALRELGEAVLPEVTPAIKAFTYAMKALSAAIELPDWLGGAAASGVKSGYNWLFGNSAAPSKQNQSVIIDHSTHLDGSVLAKSVTEYQIDGMAKAPSMSNSTDLRLSPSYAGFGLQ